jgi:hypothetical protein
MFYVKDLFCRILTLLGVHGRPAMLHGCKVPIFILGLTERGLRSWQKDWCFGLSGWLYSKLS